MSVKFCPWSIILGLYGFSLIDLPLTHQTQKAHHHTKERPSISNISHSPYFSSPIMSIFLRLESRTLANALATAKTYLPLPPVPRLAQVPRYPVNSLSSSLFMQTKIQPFASRVNCLSGTNKTLHAGITNSRGDSDSRVFCSIWADAWNLCKLASWIKLRVYRSWIEDWGMYGRGTEFIDDYYVERYSSISHWNFRKWQHRSQFSTQLQLDLHHSVHPWPIL